jgi:sodium-coupled monocarboxylate transporter 8/12
VLLVGSLGTFYTAIGGIKAVIWTDLFQLCIMLATLLLIVFKGLNDFDNGLSDVFRLNAAGGRLNIFDFRIDPFLRQSFWPLLIGHYCTFAPFYATDQQMLQRFQATRTKKLAQTALALNAPGGILIISLCTLVGLILYATYATCDPLSSGQITSPNHLVIYFVKDKLGEFKGASGLFLAAVFCGSLSSVSSTLNSMASIVFHDLFKHRSSKFKPFRNDLNNIKAIVAVLGVLSSGFALVIATFGSNLTQISTSLKGAFNSPILGIFVLGYFFTVTSRAGAVVGTVCGFGFGLFISLGAYIVKPVYPGAKLPVSTMNCSGFKTSNFSFSEVFKEPAGFEKIFYLSYMWYTTCGAVITVVVALLVSGVTNLMFKNELVYSSAEYLLLDLCPCVHRKRKRVNLELKTVGLSTETNISF